MRICSVCKENLSKERYSKKQWLRPATTRKCTKCVEVEVKSITAKSGHNGTKKQSSTEAVELAKKLASVDISEIKQPRPTTQILGRIRKNTYPTAKVLKELLDALTYERQTPSYLKAVEQMKNTKFSPNWIPPRTHETDGMLESCRQSYLLAPPPLTFNFLKHDFNEPELGGEGLLIRIEELWTTAVYLGECYFTLEDLWFFAVEFRTGGKWKADDNLPTKIAPPKPEESDHLSVLLCPFCATILNPCDEKKRYIMIGQIFCKSSYNGVQTYWMPQLCCRRCFGNNHISTRSAEKFDDFLHECELNGVKRMYLRKRKSSLLRIDCPNARDLYKYTNSTGLANAFMEHFLDEMLNEQMGEVRGLKKKMKRSKTMSEEAGGSIFKAKRELINICNACGLETSKASACSACNNTYYCSRDCQRHDWKVHKRTCGKRIEKDPLPSDDIVVSQKVEVNTADMEAMKNKCNICLKYKGDTHGCEAYCLGCGTYM